MKLIESANRWHGRKILLQASRNGSRPRSLSVILEGMEYLIREKFWSFTQDFSITDMEGRPMYAVRGKAFSWGNNLSVQDADGQELAQVKQEIWSWKPRYKMHRDGAFFAELVKEWTWFKKTFTLDVPGPNDYTIEGSFWRHDFTFLRKGELVARITKKSIFTGRYHVDIVDGEDDLSILTACIVIDQILEDAKSSSD